MTHPLTPALIGAAALAGYLIGLLLRRNLNQLRYRQGTETDQPAPGPRRWVPWVTAATIATLATTALYGTHPWYALPLLPLAAAGPWLAAVDLDVYRLPNRITAPVAAATALTVAVAALATRSWPVAILSLFGGILAAVVFLTSNLLTRGGIGMGDTKLATIVGLAIGPAGLMPVAAALIAGSFTAIIWAKTTRHTGPVAYGPWLLAGAWLSMAVVAVTV